MRHAVLAASLAFGSQLRITRGPGKAAVRRMARTVLQLLDRRRERVDAIEGGPRPA